MDAKEYRDGISRRLARAAELADDVATRSATWLRSNPLTLTSRMGADGWREFYATSPLPPADWGIPISEVVHHTRSALDNAVAALVVAAGQTPTRDHAFPIVLQESEWKARRKSALKWIPDDATEVIRELQPFAINPVNPEFPHIAALHNLWNRDKHHLLQPAQRMIAPDDVAKRLKMPLPAGVDGWSDVNVDVRQGDMHARSLTTEVPILAVRLGDKKHGNSPIFAAVDIELVDLPTDLVVVTPVKRGGKMTYTQVSWLPVIVAHVDYLIGRLDPWMGSASAP